MTVYTPETLYDFFSKNPCAVPNSDDVVPAEYDINQDGDWIRTQMTYSQFLKINEQTPHSICLLLHAYDCSGLYD